MEKTDYQITIINRVRSLRQDNGVSQAQLSVIIGVTPGQLGNIESIRYSHKYTLNQLNQIANHFGIKTETLFLEKDEEVISTQEVIERICKYIGN